MILFCLNLNKKATSQTGANGRKTAEIMIPSE